jgi:hypothetical protein
MKKSGKAKSRVIPAPSGGMHTGFARRPSREISKARANTSRSHRKHADKPANSKGMAAEALGAGIEPQLYKKRCQMAVRYQVSVRTIDNWCVDGTLPYVKRGRVVRFDTQECDAAMRKFRHKSRFETPGDGEERGNNN